VFQFFIAFPSLFCLILLLLFLFSPLFLSLFFGSCEFHLEPRLLLLIYEAFLTPCSFNYNVVMFMLIIFTLGRF
jgi:hypothetical protein